MNWLGFANIKKLSDIADLFKKKWFATDYRLIHLGLVPPTVSMILDNIGLANGLLHNNTQTLS